MVYYNPDEEEPEEPQLQYHQDIVIGLDIIDQYMNTDLKSPGYSISAEKEIEIAQKRICMEQFKRYLIEHQNEDSFIHLLDNFACEMNYRAALYPENSEAHNMYCMMHDAVLDLAYITL